MALITLEKKGKKDVMIPHDDRSASEGTVAVEYQGTQGSCLLV